MAAAPSIYEHLKKKSKKATFSNNQTILSGRNSKGDNHPPKNINAASIETRIIFAYSARKNTAKAIPEYSTWKPATISDSPSATSKGARFVSATALIK